MRMDFHLAIASRPSFSAPPILLKPDRLTCRFPRLPFVRSIGRYYVLNVKSVLLHVCLLACLFPLWSHPHVFLDNSVVAAFNENGLQEFCMRWEFDDMFSAMISEQHDKNGDGVFDENETRLLKSKAFDNLENFHYFTYLSIKGKVLPIQNVTRFKAFLESEKLVYTFRIQCPIAWKDLKPGLSVAVYDSTYFIDVAWLGDRPITAVPDTLVEASFTKMVREDKAYYYDMIEVKEMVCKFRKRKR